MRDMALDGSNFSAAGRRDDAFFQAVGARNGAVDISTRSEAAS